MPGSATQARLASSVAIAAALHVGLLMGLSSLGSSELDPRPLDVTFFQLLPEATPAPTPPPPPPAPPPPDVPSPAAIAPAAPVRPTRRAAVAPTTPPPGEATRLPVARPEPAAEVLLANDSAAEEILTRLGTPAAGDTTKEAGTVGVEAAGPAAVLPVPLADYAHASVTYPDEAIDSLASGKVLLELDVDEHGLVTGVRPRGHLGHGFDELAAKLATKYRFRPARDAKGQEVAAKIGWRMTFAPWEPGVAHIRGRRAAPEAPNGVVPLESIGGDPAATVAPPAPPAKPAAPPPPKKPLSRSETEARPIGTLSEPERHELCQWQIRIRGGVHPEKCYGGPTREDEITNMVGRGALDSNGGAWVREQGNSADLTQPTSKDRPGDDVMIFVKPEAECVHETHIMDKCSVTLGLYTECFTKLAQRPCDWRRIPACYRITQACR